MCQEASETKTTQEIQRDGKHEKPIMSAKRVLVENVARTRVGATSVPADDGPAEGDPGGKCTQK